MIVWADGRFTGSQLLCQKCWTHSHQVVKKRKMKRKNKKKIQQSGILTLTKHAFSHSLNCELQNGSLREFTCNVIPESYIFILNISYAFIVLWCSISPVAGSRKSSAKLAAVTILYTAVHLNNCRTVKRASRAKEQSTPSAISIAVIAKDLKINMSPGWECKNQ